MLNVPNLGYKKFPPASLLGESIVVAKSVFHLPSAPNLLEAKGNTS